MEERLRYLFGQYLNNRCSREELEEFLDYVQKSRHDELLRGLIKSVYQGLEIQSNDTAFVDEQGYLTVTQPSPTGVSAKKSRVSKLLPAIGIAASLLVIAAIAWYSL